MKHENKFREVYGKGMERENKFREFPYFSSLQPRKYLPRKFLPLRYMFNNFCTFSKFLTCGCFCENRPNGNSYVV